MKYRHTVSRDSERTEEDRGDRRASPQKEFFASDREDKKTCLGTGSFTSCCVARPEEFIIPRPPAPCALLLMDSFLDQLLRVALLLIFPLMLLDSVVIDRMVRLEYDFHRTEWERNGRPHGFFWIPPE